MFRRGVDGWIVYRTTYQPSASALVIANCTSGTPQGNRNSLQQVHQSRAAKARSFSFDKSPAPDSCGGMHDFGYTWSFE
jgi:hypothetical protein